MSDCPDNCPCMDDDEFDNFEDIDPCEYAHCSTCSIQKEPICCECDESLYYDDTEA